MSRLSDILWDYDRRRWGDGAVSTAPWHAEGENPLAGDQGSDFSAPGFAKLRHQLRYGHEQQVLAELAALVETEQFPESARPTGIFTVTHCRVRGD